MCEGGGVPLLLLFLPCKGTKKREIYKTKPIFLLQSSLTYKVSFKKKQKSLVGIKKVCTFAPA
jgi:hypothetical protein